MRFDIHSLINKALLFCRVSVEGPKLMLPNKNRTIQVHMFTLRDANRSKFTKKILFSGFLSLDWGVDIFVVRFLVFNMSVNRVLVCGIKL